MYMTEMTDRGDERPDNKDGPPLEHFRKKLSASGSGGGVSLHFDAHFASEYQLDPETEVDVQVVEENGDVKLEIRNIPAGFTYDDLEQFADARGWLKTDEYASEDTDEWYLTYRSKNETVRIEIDSESQVNGSVVNNVIIQSEPIDVTGDKELYNRLCAEAVRKDLRVQVNDTKGLWNQLRGSPDYETDDAPSEETFEQLSNAAEQVRAQLVCQRTSLKTTVDDLEEIVSEMESAYSELADN